jgi:hypothetical protein
MCFIILARTGRPTPTPALFNAARYSDLKVEHHSFPKLRLVLRLLVPGNRLP